MLNKKRFLIIFAIAFVAAALVATFLLLVVFRGMFYNIYMNKGDALVERGQYEAALEKYETARGWTPKNQGVYIRMAEVYGALDDYESAGEIIDEAIKNKVTSKESGLVELHTMRIRIYSETGKFKSASNYISTISDQYVRKKIESARPDEPEYSPSQGSYDKAQKMTITVRPGQSVYYTTETNLSSFPNKYIEPINIPLGDTTISMIAVDNANKLVSPIVTASFTVNNEQEEVIFDDPKMEQMVRKALDRPSGVIRVKQLEDITELSNDGCDGKLATLSDIELMPNLTALHLDGETELLSISQLAGKTKLTSLTLSSCGLESDDLNFIAPLENLDSLDLTDNALSSVAPLSNLKDLRFVFIAKNNITDLSPLDSLTKVVLIDAAENNIESIPSLSVSLETLYLSKNRISDISGVITLRNLSILDLSYNVIEDGESLSRLESLETLSVASNDIEDYEFLSSLESLVSLDVSDSAFSSAKSLSKLPLVSVVADDTELSSVSELSKVTTLTSLSIINTDVTDIKPLASIPALDYLDISGCRIKDYSVLKKFKGLYTLRAVGEDEDEFEDIEFANDDIFIVTEE